MSADLGQIPTIWKTSTIISKSKKSKERMEGRKIFKNVFYRRRNWSPAVCFSAKRKRRGCKTFYFWHWSLCVSIGRAKLAHFPFTFDEVTPVKRLNLSVNSCPCQLFGCRSVHAARRAAADNRWMFSRKKKRVQEKKGRSPPGDMRRDTVWA